MKSVFIINSDVYDRYQKYSYFFNWFEDHRDISICIWNKYASEKADIDELVPQLFDIVKNVPEWNAYIIDEPFISDDYMKQDFEESTQCSLNPYERAGLSKEYDIEQDSLLRLVFYLGGRGVEDIEYINHYSFRAIRPTQIFLITPRIFENLDMQKVLLRNQIEEEHRKILSDPENLLLDTAATCTFDYSDFWLRYEYPSNCRFLVFDMPNIESVLYEDSWFMFWMAVLTIALNRYNSSEIGAFKLYKLGIDISNEEFKHFINKYYIGLLNACDVADKEIQNEIAAIKAAREDTTCNHPSGGAKMYVHFPDTNFDKFKLSNKWFGKTKDRPRLDTEVWREYREGVAVQTHRLFKAVARGKNEAVDRMNRTFEIDMPLLRNQRLTRYDVEDIIDMLNDGEMEMIGMNTGIAASRRLFELHDAAAAHEVEKAMRPRVFTSTYFKLMAMGVGIAILGFIPFMISSAKFNTTSFVIALLASLVTGGIIALASYISLSGRRKFFGEFLDNYSRSMRANLNNVEAHAEVQGAYLTILLDYMEKYQMIKSGRVDENQMKELERLTVIRSVFEDAIDRCKVIAALCHVQLSNNPEEVGESVMFIPGAKIYLHDDTNGLMIDLNDHPDRLEPPFTFIESLAVNEEVIYGSTKYYGVEIPEKKPCEEEEHDN